MKKLIVLVFVIIHLHVNSQPIPGFKEYTYKQIDTIALKLYVKNPDNFNQKKYHPTIVFLGTKDDLIPVATAKLYKQKMEEAGNRCDLFLYDGQKHGFFNYREDSKDGNRYYTETVFQADVFLESIEFLKGKPTIKRVADQ